MFQKSETCTALEECYLISNIPKRNLASGCHLLKTALCKEMPMSFKLLLGFTCSTAADKLRFILLDSQYLRALSHGFPLFFFLAALLQKAEIF